jgi:type II secretory pathway pseudopilin PulG
MRQERTRLGFSFLELQVSLVLLGIGLAGLGPLVVMQSRQVQQIEGRLNDATTYYLVPSTAAGAPLSSTYLWSRKLGAAAQVATEDSSTVPTPPFQVHVNFQRPAEPAPDTFSGFTYLADGGLPYGPRGNGYVYGWNADNSANTRNQNSPLSPDERYDTFAYMQQGGSFSWEIAVPNGSYTVHVVAGDPIAIDGDYRISAEGVRIVRGTPSLLNHWVEGTGTVTLTDGKLTVTNAGGAKKNRIDFIDITAAAPLKKVSMVSVDKSPISEEVTAHVTVN